MKDLRLDNTESENVYDYVYTFKKDGETSVIEFYTDTSEKNITSKVAIEELADKEGCSVSKVEEKWDIDSIGISFHNPPWSSIDDLVDTIRGFNIVAGARFQPSTQGNYSPDKIHVTPTPTINGKDIEKRVDKFFSPLKVEVDGNSAKVYPRAIVNFSTTV